MATLNVVLRTDLKEDSKTGEYPLMIRLYYKKVMYPYTFDFKIQSKFWNDSTQQIKRTNYYDNYSKMNVIINKKISRSKKILERVETNEPQISPSDLRNIIAADLNDEKVDSSICYLKYLENLEQDYKDDAKYSTSKNYRYHRKRLSEFVKSDHLEYQDIDDQFVEEYLRWLRFEKQNKRTMSKGLSANTIYNELSVFRNAYKLAQKRYRHISKDNPFFYIDVKREQTEVIALNIDEVESLKKLSFEKRHMKLVRDMFLFSIYSGGIRFSDCIKLRWSQVDMKRETVHFVPHKTRSKKKGVVINPLGEVAIDILKQYQSDKVKSEKYVFDYANLFQGDISDDEEYERFSDTVAVTVNRKLKTIAERAGIEKNLSFHISRYTIGNMLLQKGMTVNDIKEMFNHSSLAVTKQYIKRIKSIDNTDKENFLKEKVSGW